MNNKIVMIIGCLLILSAKLSWAGDATNCLEVKFKNSQNYLMNICNQQPIEATWCVGDKNYCKSAVKWGQSTIQPTGNGYPLGGDSVGKEIQYRGCFGANTIYHAKDGTLSCEEPKPEPIKSQSIDGACDVLGTCNQ